MLSASLFATIAVEPQSISISTTVREAGGTLIMTRPADESPVDGHGVESHQRHPTRCGRKVCSFRNSKQGEVGEVRRLLGKVTSMATFSWPVVNHHLAIR